MHFPRLKEKAHNPGPMEDFFLMMTDNNARPSNKKDKDPHFSPNSKCPVDLWLMMANWMNGTRFAQM